ncbi:hypothetical protein AB0I77_30645 [Streptomyces sp. NPDC050619]|uniref:hypothetical protein n=1 Tax=Streptomyces sp. NPDC050619 TaxID=3157214 RepID=UPI00343E5BB1
MTDTDRTTPARRAMTVRFWCPAPRWLDRRPPLAPHAPIPYARRHIYTLTTPLPPDAPSSQRLPYSPPAPRSWTQA